MPKDDWAKARRRDIAARVLRDLANGQIIPEDIRGVGLKTDPPPKPKSKAKAKARARAKANTTAAKARAKANSRSNAAQQRQAASPAVKKAKPNRNGKAKKRPSVAPKFKANKKPLPSHRRTGGRLPVQLQKPSGPLRLFGRLGACRDIGAAVEREKLRRRIKKLKRFHAVICGREANGLPASRLRVEYQRQRDYLLAGYPELTGQVKAYETAHRQSIQAKPLTGKPRQRGDGHKVRA